MDDRRDPSKGEYFLKLLMGNQDHIYTFILSMVHNGNDADDIMQETIMCMWRKFEQYTPGTSFNGWGITIARNYILRFFEKNRQNKLCFSSDIEKKIDMIASKKLTSSEDRVEALRSCLKKISIQSYNLVKLRYVKKIPTKTIALDRGIAPHTMYRIMGRIHQTLYHCVRNTLLRKEGGNE